MLIYRDDDRRIETRDALASVMRAATLESADPDAALSLFIDVAELEAAVTDAISPDRDALDPLACELRQATLAAAGMVIGEPAGVGRGLLEGLERVTRHTLPQTIVIRVSEGYAYYALFPETYAASAERFWSVTRPSHVVVIGIRSIGASLSAIVEQSLRTRGCETWSCTVRPRGHPFDRRLALAGDIEAAWRDRAARGAIFAIVDEGPGLSGSSFASVASAIRALGVSPDRIALFPAWDPPSGRLKSRAAEETWRAHRRWCTDAHDTRCTPERVFDVASPAVSLSGGAWRSVLLCEGDSWPAVQPQHERWKIAVPSEQRVLRYAGLGRYGESVRDRAQRLAGIGVAPQPGRLRHGFLELPFIAGQPLTRCHGRNDAIQVGRYVAVVAREFAAPGPADTSLLAHMIDTNIRELLDRSTADRVRASCRDVPRDLPAALIDGRMLAHEWIRTDEGLSKVDALDHHRDHFFPGPQSPAWDLAGAILELQLDDQGSAALLAEYERVSGDDCAGEALPFYRVAYAAFRAGYAAVAAETLAGTDEAVRFARARDRYVRALMAPNGP